MQVSVMLYHLKQLDIIGVKSAASGHKHDPRHTSTSHPPLLCLLNVPFFRHVQPVQELHHWMYQSSIPHLPVIRHCTHLTNIFVPNSANLLDVRSAL